MSFSLGVISGTTVAVTYATWNPADKGAGVTLSNGNLTAQTGAAATSLVRSTLGVLSGQKAYWEITVTTVNTTEIGISVPFANDYYDYGNINRAGGSVIYSGANHYGTLGTATGLTTGFTSGDVIGVALDMSGASGTCTFYKNGTLITGSFTGIPLNTTYACLANAGVGADSLIANFGASAFVYTPPTGYRAGIYQ